MEKQLASPYCFSPDLHDLCDQSQSTDFCFSKVFVRRTKTFDTRGFLMRVSPMLASSAQVVVIHTRLCQARSSSASRSGARPAGGWMARDGASAWPDRVAFQIRVSCTVAARSRNVSPAALALLQSTPAKPTMSGSD